MTLHDLAPAKELLRASFFIVFLILGFRARRSRQSALLFIGWTIGAATFVGLTQLEAWPFSNWALIHTLRQPSLNRLDLVGIDEAGHAWIIDTRVLEPFAFEEFDTWMRMEFMRIDEASRQAIASDIIRRAELGRRRFIATGEPGRNGTILGPLTAPRHFHRAAIWRSRSDVPSVPFRRLQIRLEQWDIEALARNPRAIRESVVYESQ